MNQQTPLPQRADVVVIGGGVIGLCTTYELLRRGRSVTLIERATLGAGSSSGNAGLIVPSHIVPLAAPGVVRQALGWMLKADSPFAIRPPFDPGLIAWLVRFAANCREQPMQHALPVLRDLGLCSARLLDQLIAEERLDCHYQASGVLSLCLTPAALAAARHEAKLLHEHGMTVALLDREALQAQEPSVRGEVVGAALFHADAYLNPACLVQELGRRVRELGATIYEQTEVTGFAQAGSAIAAVHTTRGSLQPEQVVLAAGVWSRPIARDLNLALPVQPAKGYSMTMRLPKAGLRRPMLLAEHKIAVTPMGPVLRCTGRLELTGINARVRPQPLNAIRRSVARYLDFAQQPQVLATWAGLRPATPDGLPIIGRSSRQPNLIVATGHAMLGVSLSAVTGRLAAQLACNEPPDLDLAPLRVERFA